MACATNRGKLCVWRYRYPSRIVEKLLEIVKVLSGLMRATTTKLREHTGSLAILAVIKVLQDPLQMIGAQLRHPVLVFVGFLADLQADGPWRRTLNLRVILFKVLPHQTALHHKFVGFVSCPI